MKEIRIQVSTTFGLKSAVQLFVCPDWVDDIAVAPFQFDVQSAYNKAHCYELECALKTAVNQLASMLDVETDVARDSAMAYTEEDLDRTAERNKDGYNIAETIRCIQSLDKELKDWGQKPTLEKVSSLAGSIVVAMKLTRANISIPEWFGDVYDVMFQYVKASENDEMTDEIEKAARSAVLSGFNQLYRAYGRKELVKLTKKAFLSSVSAVMPKIKPQLSKIGKDGKVTRAGLLRKAPGMKKTFPEFLASFLYFNGFNLEENKKQEIKELKLF